MNNGIKIRNQSRNKSYRLVSAERKVSFSIWFAPSAILCFFDKMGLQTWYYSLQNWLTDLEIFATLVAALIHDYEHTGTTNNFHVMSGSDTALLYNDRAVLENHHISASFRYVQKFWKLKHERLVSTLNWFSWTICDLS